MEGAVANEVGIGNVDVAAYGMDAEAVRVGYGGTGEVDGGHAGVCRGDLLEHALAEDI